MSDSEIREALLRILARVKTGLSWADIDWLVEMGWCEWHPIREGKNDGVRPIITVEGIKYLEGINNGI